MLNRQQNVSATDCIGLMKWFMKQKISTSQLLMVLFKKNTTSYPSIQHIDSACLVTYLVWSVDAWHLCFPYHLIDWVDRLDNRTNNIETFRCFHIEVNKTHIDLSECVKHLLEHMLHILIQSAKPSLKCVFGSKLRCGSLKPRDCMSR